jgi:DNA adenine methylase
MNNKPIRSPLFYVGDKYKLMPQLLKLFPDNINNYYDVFTGGGSASINVNYANNYYMNDANSYIYKLHLLLQKESNNIDGFIDECYNIIKQYNLSLSEIEKNEKIEELKKIYKKTYFAKYNKENYLKLRDDYNNNQNDIILLYLLLIYGFNHFIRFNKKGKFNQPVGNVDWNKNVSNALRNYTNWYNNHNVFISNLDFEDFIKKQNFEKDDFLYLDPPYLITNSEYNKIWNEDNELRLYELLDELDNKNIVWGLSNMISHKGKYNDILDTWSKKYDVYEISSNYISRFDNTIKKRQ